MLVFNESGLTFLKIIFKNAPYCKIVANVALCEPMLMCILGWGEKEAACIFYRGQESGLCTFTKCKQHSNMTCFTIHYAAYAGMVELARQVPDLGQKMMCSYWIRI